GQLWSPGPRCPAGRQDAVLSPPRSAGSSSRSIALPGEESRCLLQDLALLTQPRILAPKPAKLLALLARQPLTLTVVDLALANPAPQRLRRHRQLLGDRAIRPLAHPIQPDRLLPELRRETLALCHIDSLPDACASIVRVSTRPGQLQGTLRRRCAGQREDIRAGLHDLGPFAAARDSIFRQLQWTPELQQ